MLSNHIDWKNGLGFVCCVKVVITVVDINDDKCSFTPYVDNEVEDPGVTFPLGKDFADNTVRRGTIVLMVEGFCIHFDNDSSGIVVSEDHTSYIG